MAVKRFEMETTTSLNIMRNNFNSVLKNMDKLGYSNYLKNNYFKSKLKRGGGVNIISKWYNADDDTIPGSPDDYDGLATGTNAKFYDDGHFAVKNNVILGQHFIITNAERLSNNGVFTVSTFFLKGYGTLDVGLSLQYWDTVAVTWTNITALSTRSEVITNTYDDPSAYYGLNGTANKVIFGQVTNTYNLSSNTTYEDAQYFRVILTAPNEAYWKVLMNTVSYFGSIDVASFVKNYDEEKSVLTYDETAGDYYYTTDGQDKVYLSSGKYILSVGDYGVYTTIQDALDSIAEDHTNYGNARIIYLTSDVTLGGDLSIPSNIKIFGNGYKIKCDGNTISIRGTGGGVFAKTNISIENVKFDYADSSAVVAESMIDLYYAENIRFTDCYVDGNFLYSGNIVAINLCDKINLGFTEFKNYGYNTTLAEGYGIYITNSTKSNINIQSLVLNGASDYSPTALIGVYVDSATCADVNVNVQTFDEV